jgi:hypothetical protein
MKGVLVSGLEILPKVASRFLPNQSDYEKYIHDELRRQSGVATGAALFSSQRHFQDFNSKLPLHVDEFLSRSLDDIVKSVDDALPLQPTVPKKKALKTQDQVSVQPTADGTNRRKRRLSDAPVAQEALSCEVSAESPVTTTSPTSKLGPALKKRQIRGGERVNEITLAWTVPVLPNVCSDFVNNLEMKIRHSEEVGTGTGYGGAIGAISNQLSLQGKPQALEGVQTIEEMGQIQLDRRIFTVLSVIEEAIIPHDQPWTDWSNPSSSRFCLFALISRLEQERSICTSRWWEDPDLNLQTTIASLIAAKKSGKGSRQSKAKLTSSSREAPVDSTSLLSPDEEIDRHLCEDYYTIPYDEFPNYDSLVMHPLTVDQLKKRLQEHHYHSFGEFSKDFYEMLNNGRSITSGDSKVTAA